jgi:hypothetical protein
MSAFVVGPDTMTNAMRALTCSGQIRRFGEFDTAIATAGRDIGRALYAMNIAAVMERYPDCRADPTNLPGWDGCHLMPTTFDFGDFRPVSDADLIVCTKALHCVRYQCSEGDIHETPLWIALDSACKHLDTVIVTSLPAWQRAAWGD